MLAHASEECVCHGSKGVVLFSSRVCSLPQTLLPCHRLTVQGLGFPTPRPRGLGSCVIFLSLCPPLCTRGNAVLHIDGEAHQCPWLSGFRLACCGQIPCTSRARGEGGGRNSGGPVLGPRAEHSAIRPGFVFLHLSCLSSLSGSAVWMTGLCPRVPR